MRNIALGILLIFIIAGCGGSFERPAEEKTEGAKPEEMTPDRAMGLKDDYENVPAKYPVAAKVDSTDLVSEGGITIPGDSTDDVIQASESYRIQLFTSSTYGPATKELNIAKEVFDRPVYMDYEVPYYKVRIADFRSRREAEDYLPAAKEAGYNNAWVVRVNLNVENIEDIYDEEMPSLIDTTNINVDDSVLNSDEPVYPED